MLNHIQEEMKPWTLHNFGERPASQPLRGIIEEFGELNDAVRRLHRADMGDAVADIVIFMMDYCNVKGLNIDDVWHVTGSSVSNERDILITLGKLCHHDLKQEQGIRLNENHPLGISRALSHLLHYLHDFCEAYGLESYVTLTLRTWDKVKQRDWKKNPSSGT